MAIRRRTTSSLAAGTLDVAISHTSDSIQIGDGTNLLGTFPSAGGVRSLPVYIKGSDVHNKTDDAAFTIATDTVTPIGGVYKSSLDNVDDGDVGAIHMTQSRALHVYIKGSDVATGAAPSMTDDSAFSVATSAVAPMGAMADETAPDSVDEGDIGVLRMTLDRLLKVQVAGVASGVAIPITDNSGSITVDGTVGISGSVAVTGTFWQATQPVSGTFWQATQPVSIAATVTTSDANLIADNAGFTDGTSKVMPSGYIFDEVAGTALTENDVGAARMDSKRAVVFALEDASTRGQRASVSAAGAVKVDGSAVTQPVSGTFWQATQPVSGTFWQATQPVSIAASVTVAQGTASNLKSEVVGPAAHDAAVSGNPVRVAGRAMLANGTAVAEDDTADIATDNQGRVVVTPHVPRDLVTHGTATLTSTTETSVIAAGGAGVFHDLTKIILSNSSSTATRVQVRDASAGTIRLEVALAANGGAVIDFGNVPMCMTTANNAWYATLSGAVTSIYVYYQAIKRIA